MSANTLEELKLGERKFLHDIANHIVVAHGMASVVIKKLKDNPSVEAKEIERLEKSIEAINKMSQEIKARRAVLMGDQII